MKTLASLGVLVAFAVSGGLIWNYLRNRPEVAIQTLKPPSAPFADAMCSGFRLARKEAGDRAGRVRVTEGPEAATYDPNHGSLSFKVGNFHLAPLSFRSEEPLFHILAGPEQLVDAALAWVEREGLHVSQLLTEPDDERSSLMEHSLREAWKKRRTTAQSPLILHAGESAPFSAAAKTYRKLKDSGFKGRFLVFDAHPEVSCVDAPGQPEDGMLLVTPIFPPPADFIPLYRAYAHKDPGPHVYGGYLAGKAALDIIARARSTSPEDLLSAASGIRPHPPALYVARGGRFHFVELLSFPAR